MKGRRVKLAEIVDIIQGYPLAIEDKTEDGTICIIQSGDIENGCIKGYLSTADLPKLQENQILKTGDLVLEYRLGCVNTLLFVAGHIPITVAAPLVILRLHNLAINMHYLATYLESQEGIALISATAPDGELEGFSQDKLMKLSFILPNIEKQR